MEGGFGYVIKSCAGRLLLFFHMQPNGMQLDQMPAIYSLVLQTCFDNFQSRGPLLRKKVPWQLTMLIEDLKYVNFGECQWLYMLCIRESLQMLGPWLFQSLINIFALYCQPNLVTLLYPKRRRRRCYLTPLWTNLCLWHMFARNHYKVTNPFPLQFISQVFPFFYSIFLSCRLLFRHLGVQQNIYNVKFEWKWVLSLEFSHQPVILIALLFNYACLMCF